MRLASLCPPSLAGALAGSAAHWTDALTPAVDCLVAAARLLASRSVAQRRDAPDRDAAAAQPLPHPTPALKVALDRAMADGKTLTHEFARLQAELKIAACKPIEPLKPPPKPASGLEPGALATSMDIVVG
jgi:hypothetical protein